MFWRRLSFYQRKILGVETKKGKKGKGGGEKCDELFFFLFSFCVWRGTRANEEKYRERIHGNQPQRPQPQPQPEKREERQNVREREQIECVKGGKSRVRSSMSVLMMQEQHYQFAFSHHLVL